MLEIGFNDFVTKLDKARHNTGRIFYALTDKVYPNHGDNHRFIIEFLVEATNYILDNMPREVWSDETTTLKHNYQTVKRINKVQARFKAMCDALTSSKRKGLSREMRQVSLVLETLEDHIQQGAQVLQIASETISTDAGA